MLLLDPGRERKREEKRAQNKVSGHLYRKKKKCAEKEKEKKKRANGSHSQNHLKDKVGNKPKRERLFPFMKRVGEEKRAPLSRPS